MYCILWSLYIPVSYSVLSMYPRIINCVVYIFLYPILCSLCIPVSYIVFLMYYVSLYPILCSLCIPVSYIVVLMYYVSLYPILCSLYICIVLSGLDSSPRPWVGSNLYNPYVSLCSIDPNHIKQGRGRTLPPPSSFSQQPNLKWARGAVEGGGNFRYFLIWN